MKNAIRFFRVQNLPNDSSIGDIYFVSGSNPSIYIYVGGDNPWELYTKQQSLYSEITYSDLLHKVQTNQLEPGKQYRIIDYCTMTKSSDLYHSAQHPFDLIVTANSINTLNENAKAIQHEGDSYFSNSNLSSWKIKYTIHNDNFYNWVDDSCKGVIYEMTDEFGNTCPYDFKNILQVRYLVSGTNTNADGKYLGWSGYTYNQDSYIHCYTFSKNTNGVSEDVSLNNVINVENTVISCSGNKISQLIISEYCYLNDIVFVCDDNYSQTVCKRLQNIVLGPLNYNITFGPQCYDIATGDDCHDIIFSDFSREVRLLDYCRNLTFGRNCYGFQLGNDCSNLVAQNDCWSFTIGNECYNIKIGTNCRRFNIGNYSRDWELGDNCQIITTGNNCSNWKTGNSCSFWSVGNQCYEWTTGNNCSSWSCQNSCNNWSVGNNCSKWSTGNECYSWSTGNDCVGWSTGNECYSWSCKDQCSYWKVGNGCFEWAVGNNCRYFDVRERVYRWRFGNANGVKDYFSNITILSNNHNFYLNTTYTTSSSNACRGILISEMTFANLNDYNTYSLTDTNGNVNQLFQTTIGRAGDKKLNVS